MRNSLPILFLLLGFCPLPHASAHYLWVTIDNQSGEHGLTRIFFEESPSAGDGHYLDHFSGTSKTWFRSVEQIESELLKTSDINQGEKRWFEAKLPAGSPRSIDCYGKFGVYRYGQTNVLLHYYARNQRAHAVNTKMDEMLRLAFVAFIREVSPPKRLDLLLVVILSNLGQRQSFSNEFATLFDKEVSSVRICQDVSIRQALVHDECGRVTVVVIKEVGTCVDGGIGFAIGGGC